MSRPVAKWQWASTGEHDDPNLHASAAATFWLRMEHLPPATSQLVEETYPPKDVPKRHYRHRSITPADLKAALAEVGATNWEQELGRTPRTARRAQPAAIRRAAIHNAATDITERSTAAAERMLGLDNHENTRRTA